MEDLFADFFDTPQPKEVELTPAELLLIQHRERIANLRKNPVTQDEAVPASAIQPSKAFDEPESKTPVLDAYGVFRKANPDVHTPFKEFRDEIYQPKDYRASMPPGLRELQDMNGINQPKPEDSYFLGCVDPYYDGLNKGECHVYKKTGNNEFEKLDLDITDGMFTASAFDESTQTVLVPIKPEPLDIPEATEFIIPDQEDKGQSDLFSGFDFELPEIPPNHKIAFKTETPMLDKALDQAIPTMTGNRSPEAEEAIAKLFGISSLIPHVMEYHSQPNYLVKNPEISNKWDHIYREHSTGALPTGNPYQIKIKVLGEPAAQKRHRTVQVKGMKFPMNYDPSSSDKADFLSLIHEHAPATPFTVALRVDVFFYFTRPASHYGTGSKSGILKPSAPLWKISKPDRDNLDKFVMDSMNKIYWKDDSVVCAGEIIKKYDENPRTEIIITVL